jgi:hypothetical protein
MCAGYQFGGNGSRLGIRKLSGGRREELRGSPRAGVKVSRYCFDQAGRSDDVIIFYAILFMQLLDILVGKAYFRRYKKNVLCIGHENGGGCYVPERYF